MKDRLTTFRVKNIVEIRLVWALPIKKIKIPRTMKMNQLDRKFYILMHLNMTLE